jgi:hypothetical protein
MRRFLAGTLGVVEDGRMDGYYEEVEKYRNKRPYVPLVPARAVLLVEAMDGFVPEIKPDAVAVNLGSYMSGRSPCI